MDALVAGTADYEGLAASLGHEMHPCGSFTSAGAVEIGELADVVNLEALLGVADLAALGKQPVDQLVAPGAGHDR
jgi:hypothetical protein